MSPRTHPDAVVSARSCIQAYCALVVDELVADPGDGAQELTLVVAELAAQAVDVDAQVLGLGAVVGPPHVLEDHAVRADLAGVAGQEHEQRELPGRELDGPARPCGPRDGRGRARAGPPRSPWARPRRRSGARWRSATRSRASSSPIPKGLVM